MKGIGLKLLWLPWLLFFLAGKDSRAQRFSERPFVINEKMGLPDNVVNAIVFDQEGFLWIATPKGLCRFDGSYLRVFGQQTGDTTSLPNDHVINVQLDRNGRLWAATIGGLGRYDSKTQTFRQFLADPADPDALPASRVFCIFQDRQNEIWVGVENGGLVNYREKENRFVKYPIRVEAPDTTVDASRINSILDIAQDVEDENILWLATLSGLVKYNKQTHTYRWYPQLTEDREKYLANTFKAVLPLAGGKIITGTWDGASWFDAATEQFTPILPPDKDATMKISQRMVRSLVLLADGNIGITYTIGYAVFDPRSGQVVRTYYNEEDRVYGVNLIDAQNRLWCRSNTGVYLYNPLNDQFRIYEYPVTISHYVHDPRAVLESGDGKSLYLCSFDSEGLYIFDRKTSRWSIVPPPKSALNHEGSFLATDMIRLKDGRIIVCTENKLLLFDERRRKLVPFLPDLDFNFPNFRQMVQGQGGDLWIGSRRSGLFRINLATGAYRVYREELNTSYNHNRYQWIENLYVDRQGRIWLRTAVDYSIYLPAEDRFINIRPAKGNDFPNIVSFMEGQGDTMWMAGAENGLGMALVDSLEKGIVEKYSRKDGIFNDYILNIGKDLSGNIWLDNENSLTRFDPETRQFQYYGSTYGVPESNQEILQVLSTGEMVMGVKNGICIFYPDKLWVNTERPIPYLLSFKVFDQELLDRSDLTDIDEIELSYRQNFFAFEFSARTYNVPDQVNYAYMLQGVDADWNYSGRRNYASYTNIDGGDYVFKVKAANNEGVWNEEVFQLNISISTPWWKAVWFWLLMLILLIGLGVSIFRWRIRQVREQEMVKRAFEKKLANVELNALRAQMNPHFIFNCLNSIDYYILKNDSDTASDYLNRFSRLIRLILQNSRSNYVNLKDELEALKLYIEMESLRFEKKFEYVVQVERNLRLDEYEVPPMLLQPYVENAIWHGLVQKQDGKGRVELTITRENGHLHCIIQDNGIGREAAQQLRSKNATRHKSMGMDITNERINMINKLYQTNANVRIIDLKNADGIGIGTRVELDLPY